MYFTGFIQLNWPPRTQALFDKQFLFIFDNWDFEPVCV